MPPYFDDDGTEVNPDLIPKPALCIMCKKNLEPGFEDDILCNLTRMDERNNKEFICYSFKDIKE
jgi:hypothetical protein